jgi:hypothetical protein
VRRRRCGAPHLGEGGCRDQLFHLSCRDVRWAIIDSGVDATHPAFRRSERQPPDRGRLTSPGSATSSRQTQAVADGLQNAIQDDVRERGAW